MFSPTCPHCGSQRMVSMRVPKDMVVVLPCSFCHELVVLFRHKAIGLNRKVLEHGSFDAKKEHLAEVIAEFLEPGFLSLQGLSFGSERHDDNDGSSDNDCDSDDLFSMDSDDMDDAISQGELDQFLCMDLPQLDDPEYFRKHFG